MTYVFHSTHTCRCCTWAVSWGCISPGTSVCLLACRLSPPTHLVSYLLSLPHWLLLQQSYQSFTASRKGTSGLLRVHMHQNPMGCVMTVRLYFSPEHRRGSGMVCGHLYCCSIPHWSIPVSLSYTVPPCPQYRAGSPHQ